MSETTQIEIIEDSVVGDFRRVVQENPGHNRYYILIGPGGAVQFAVMATGGSFGVDFPGMGVVMGMEVGYHAYEQSHEYELHSECPWLLGTDKCYYDGSGLEADAWLKTWSAHQFEPNFLWALLMNYYTEVFSR